MSKQLAMACFYIGKGYGQSVFQHDLEDDTEYLDDLKTAQMLNDYAALAVSMVEQAYSLTMEYPEGIEHCIYGEFGIWFGDTTSEDDEGEPPSHEDSKQTLVDYVMEEFDGLLAETQKTKLRQQLESF